MLALVAAFVLGACGGDDDADTGGGTTETTAQRDSDDNGDQTGSSGEASQPEASDGEGYPDQVRRNFMNACVAQPGATQAACECTFDEIAETVPSRSLSPTTGPPGRTLRRRRRTGSRRRSQRAAE